MNTNTNFDNRITMETAMTILANREANFNVYITVKGGKITFFEGEGGAVVEFGHLASLAIEDEKSSGKCVGVDLTSNLEDIIQIDDLRGMREGCRTEYRLLNGTITFWDRDPEGEIDDNSERGYPIDINLTVIIKEVRI